MKTRLKVKGELELSVYEHDQLLYTDTSSNLVVNQGIENIQQLLAGSALGKPITKFAAGTNATAVDNNDTTITGAFTKAITSATPGPTYLQIDFSIETNENNGMNMAEYGLMDVDNRLLARITKSPIVKNSSLRIVGRWNITISNV